MARSLNRVELIGNLTRDPELRYTPSGSAVCSFGIATNRSWTTDTGEKHDEPEFHNIVAWNKLAEICSQFLTKGRQVYVEGRLATRKWTGQDGQARTSVEIIINEMILLGSSSSSHKDETTSSDQGESEAAKPVEKKTSKKAKPEETEADAEEIKAPEAAESTDEEVAPGDIPF